MPIWTRWRQSRRQVGTRTTESRNANFAVSTFPNNPHFSCVRDAVGAVGLLFNYAL